VRQIHEMDIQDDQMIEVLCLSQQGYLKKFVEGFIMHEPKPVDIHLDYHTKLSVTQTPILKKNGKRCILFYMLMLIK